MSLEHLGQFLLKQKQELLSVHLNNKNFWVMTGDLKQAYVWGSMDFLEITLEKNHYKKLEIFGDYPQKIVCGKSSTVLFFKKQNELKFYGDFEIY